MNSIAATASWATLVRILTRSGLSDQLSRSELEESWLHEGNEAEGAPSAADVEALLPSAYRAFVAQHGYPLIAAPSRLNYAFAFLPPLAMRQVSALLVDEEMAFDEAQRARIAGGYVWQHVMFAGWNFADGDGWAFGFDPEEDEGSEPLVWLVEGGSVVELVGSFEEWLEERAGDVRARVEALDAEALAAAVAREGEYEYGPWDLAGFDG